MNPDFESATTQRQEGLDTEQYMRMSLDLKNEPLRKPRDLNQNCLDLHSQSSGKDQAHNMVITPSSQPHYLPD